MARKVAYERAPDLQQRMETMVGALGMAHIDPSRVVCLRSWGSQGRFLARIWPLERVWQLALGVGAHYAIEAKGEAFARMTPKERDEVLIHELLHIPRTFSGSLRMHRHPGGRIDGKAVRNIYRRWEIWMAEEGAETPPSRRV